MNSGANPFDGIAEKYEMWYQDAIGACMDRQEKDAVTDALKGMNDCSLLDVGCGTGHWSRFFHYLGYEVTGIDISDKMLHVARQKSPGGIHYSPGDAARLDFEDETFDITTAITLLEFVEDDKKVLNEMWRVTKPGGRMILGVLNRYSIIGLSRELRKERNIFTSARFYSMKELNNLLHWYGRSRVTGSTFCLPWEWALDYADLLEELGKLFFPFWGTFLVGVAFKYT